MVMNDNKKKIEVKKDNPIKLHDLIPRENVKGGKTKTVFGVMRDFDRKRPRFS